MGETEAKADERPCPACGSRARDERGEKNGYRILDCKACRTLYTDRVPAPASTEACDYEEYYHEGNLNVPDFVHKRLDEIFAEYEPYRKEGRFLDVGFGSGVMMQAAARAGWTPMGQEISRKAAEHARAQGFEVFCGELADARYPDNHFDVIACSEVLEHVPDPRSLAAEMARLLRPGGLLWATTPHGNSISERILKLKWSLQCPPEHLQLFSVKGMKGMLADVGFSRAKVFTLGVNPFEIWHTLRHGRAAAAGAAGDAPAEPRFDRTESSYQLNEFLTRNPASRAAKTIANGLIRISGMGDALKIWAVK